MEISVGPFVYRVRMVHGLIRHEGRDCYGLCDNLAQQILVSDVPPEAQRLQVFVHELMHAWWYHFDVNPADQEAVVDLVGMAMTDFLLRALKRFCGYRDLGASDLLPVLRGRPTRPKPAAKPVGMFTLDQAQPLLSASVVCPDSGWVIQIFEPAA